MGVLGPESNLEGRFISQTGGPGTGGLGGGHRLKGPTLKSVPHLMELTEGEGISRSQERELMTKALPGWGGRR